MKKNVLRQPKTYEKADFRTPTGGSGYIIRNNPLARGGKLSRTAGGGV
jgi:hypothetical protein